MSTLSVWLWFTLGEYMLVYENRASKIRFFWCQGTFFMNFDSKNECKNEFKDNNEKSCSWSRNKISQKFRFWSRDLRFLEIFWYLSKWKYCPKERPGFLILIIFKMSKLSVFRKNLIHDFRNYHEKISFRSHLLTCELFFFSKSE